MLTACSRLRAPSLLSAEDNNPIGLQILGICSALAVTSNLNTALV
ncbi:MAG: hypothetical protein K0M60_13705, partial [Hydrogenophaga sp.]|nr:hypothetical protein [Hydrogenophaga sp.]